MRIGDELRKAREAAGLSQEQLAERAQVSRVYVSQLERDKKSPTLDVYFRLCAALRVTPAEMMQRIQKAR